MKKNKDTLLKNIIYIFCISIGFVLFIIPQFLSAGIDYNYITGGIWENNIIQISLLIIPLISGFLIIYFLAFSEIIENKFYRAFLSLISSFLLVMILTGFLGLGNI